MDDNQKPLKEEFKNAAGLTLDQLLEDAALKSFCRFMIAHQAPAVYERFAKTVDAYVDAITQVYPSLTALIDDYEQGLQKLVAQKGIKQDGAILSFDDELRNTFDFLNKSIYDTQDDGRRYYDRDAFAQYFVIQIPQACNNIRKQLETMPDAPAADATSKPKAPGA